jgi:hypothetical protein
MLGGPQPVAAAPEPVRSPARSAHPEETPRALEAHDVADTQVLTLTEEPAPPPEAPTPPDGRIRPAKIEYVTVPGSPAVRMQPPADPEQPTTRYEMSAGVRGLDVYTFAPPVDDAERTANGLRKRSPRSRKTGPQGADRPAGAVATRTAPRPAAVSDSADDVRTRLTAFRRGVQRGSTEPTDRA